MIGMGIAVGLSRMRGLSLAGMIRALFSTGEKGVWYDPSDLTSMFIDSAGTDPAVIGQPVGYIADKSGNGNHATQATLAKKPTLRQSGALYYLEFDGVDDHLKTSTLASPIAQPTTYFIGLSLNVVNASMHITDGDATNRQYILSDAAAKLSLNAGLQALQTNTNAANTPYVFTGTFNGASSSGRRNGTAVIAGNSGTGALGQLWIGSNYLAGTCLNGHIFSLIVRGALSSASEITSAETYVNSKTGAY